VDCMLHRSGHEPLPSQQTSNLLLNFSPVTLQDSGWQVDAASVKEIAYNQKEGGGEEESKLMLAIAMAGRGQTSVVGKRGMKAERLG
jgi:hypothetical protein